MNKTLEHILGRFNLDRAADYSKVSLPIGLRMNRRQLAELFCDLGYRIGAEIGTAAGHYAETLCKANPEGKLICVDPWMAYSDYKDYRRQSTLDDLYNAAQARLEPYNVEFLRSFSVEAATRFDDESLDFIFLDANHSYEHVLADLEAWVSKVKPSGIVSGHDFTYPKEKAFGVDKAVTEWVNRFDIKPWFTLKGQWEAEGDICKSWMYVKE